MLILAPSCNMGVFRSSILDFFDLDFSIFDIFDFGDIVAQQLYYL